MIVPECDGARILNQTHCEFLRLVPDHVASIFEVASLSAPALLYDALQSYEKGDVKADEHIRTITRQRELDSAIEACVSHHSTHRVALCSLYLLLIRSVVHLSIH